MLYTTLDNFYYSRADLEASTPSRMCGVPEPVEAEQRVYGCELIQEGGLLLKLPQVVMATGQVLFHRFYCKESLTKVGVKRAACACAWLATKLEETPRRLRDVLAVFHRMDLRRSGAPLEPLDFYSKRFEEVKAGTIRIERLILRSLGFILHVEHPHKLVLNHLHIMSAENELMQEAWNLTNDSLRTTLCVQYKSEVVACGIIFLAARRLKVPLPEKPEPWWELHGVSFAQVCDVCRQVNKLYSRPRAAAVAMEDLTAPSSRQLTPRTVDTSPAVEAGNADLSQGPQAQVGAPL